MLLKVISMLLFLVSMASTVSGSEVIKEAQRILNDLGFNAGAVDGLWGSKTEAALNKFYDKQGLAFDGELDQKELNDLNLAIATSGQKNKRWYVDQPDQNSDYKIHFNYIRKTLMKGKV